MNYIGSKHKLVGWIEEVIVSVVNDDLSSLKLCDIFAGTGAVSRRFKPKVKHIIANDLEYYSFILNKHYLSNNITPNDDLLNNLNYLPSEKGFIYENYSGTSGRLYFSEHNAMKIDSIRIEIECLHKSGCITDDDYYFALASLLEASDKVANTACVYASFLKKLKASACKPVTLLPPVIQNGCNAEVYNLDANELIMQVEGDILYIDPPYNTRQYGSNYHILNTIALYDKFDPKGKTGMRPYNKSDFSSKAKAFLSLDNLIKNAKFKYIFLSYNDEGILSPEQIRNIMTKYGAYCVFSKKHQRFTTRRNETAKTTVETIHILKKPC